MELWMLLGLIYWGLWGAEQYRKAKHPNPHIVVRHTDGGIKSWVEN